MAKYLVQLLLPLNDNGGRRLSGALFQEVREELVARFGGLTAFSRAPVERLCQDEARRAKDGERLVCEVMTGALDRARWDGCGTAWNRPFVSARS